MHGYMSKMGNPFLTQWQRRVLLPVPQPLEWRGRRGPGKGSPAGDTRWAGRPGVGPGPHRQLPALQQEPADHGGDPGRWRRRSKGEDASSSRSEVASSLSCSVT